jgi:hypothetical protein
MAKKENAEGESKELTSWQAAIAADAKKVAHNEGTDSSAIRIQHGMMMYHDQPIPNNELDVIVIASITERCYYDGPYNPDKIESPTCFAQSRESRDLVPHENVKEPQNETCEGCPKAEFGSAKQGKGPACKTYRKLAMIPANTAPEEVRKAEVAYIKVSPTSVKNWSKYAQQLVASAGIPPWAATTKIKVVPDKKTIWQVTFQGLGPISDAPMLANLHERIDGAENMLLRPYTYEEDEAEGAKY